MKFVRVKLFRDFDVNFKKDHIFDGFLDTRNNLITLAANGLMQVIPSEFCNLPTFLTVVDPEQKNEKSSAEIPSTQEAATSTVQSLFGQKMKTLTVSFVESDT